MRNFNFYKKEIEEHIEDLRIAAFYVLDFIDFSTYDSIVESIHFNDFKFEEVDAYSFVFSMDYEGNNYIFNYDYRTKNGIFFLEDEPNTNLSINVDSKLLNHLDTGQGKIDLNINLKPKIHNSKTLRKDIFDFLNNECTLIDHMFIFDQAIDIDSTVRANVFLFVYDLNIALDIKGTFKNGDLRIKKLNIFNIKNISKNDIEYSDTNILGNEHSRNIEKAKYFFENVLTKQFSDDVVQEFIEEKGIAALLDEDLREIIKLNISI